MYEENYKTMMKEIKDDTNKGFPGGVVVESPPADSGDTVRAPVREDPTCRGAAGPVSHGR